jgi:hypothetical protein
MLVSKMIPEACSTAASSWEFSRRQASLTGYRESAAAEMKLPIKMTV